MLVAEAPRDEMPKEGAVYVGSSEMPKRNSVPSSTRSQYMNNSRAGARRKRKHTELKRSGILERRRHENQAAATLKNASAQRAMPLHKSPTWAEGISREGRELQCDATQVGEQSKTASTTEHDHTLYRLKVEVHGADSATVHWWFPPANPGSQNAWIGLYRAKDVEWNEDSGEVGGGGAKIAWRLITADKQYGKMKFGSLFGANPMVDDGEYCFALMPDYGTVCKAVSERLAVKARKVVSVVADSGLFADAGGSIHRQDRQKSASLGLISVNKVADQNAEVEDERCYFPVPSISVHLGERFTDAHPVLKDIYRIVDKESFLDWGLTSDSLGGEAASEEGHRLRKTSASGPDGASDAPPLDVDGRQYSELLPAAAPRAKRGAEHTPSGRGLGGGTLGSEGYGEATMASCARLGVLLQNLRQLVLNDLCPFIHWGMLWDLGPHSSFLDIGSGYGKVVLHLRVVSGMRKSVGVECVASRVVIGNKALLSLYNLDVEDGTRPARQAKGEAKGEAKGRAAAAKPPSKPTRPTKLAEARADVLATAEDDAASAGSSACTDAAPAAEGGVGVLSAVGGELSAVPWLPDAPFQGVEFLHSDVTKEASLKYTHIYIFDWVFSKHTLHAVAELLQRSPFYVMLSTRKPAEWWSYGLVKAQPVAKLTGFKTTGGEGMTMYVYVNLEKVPQLPQA